MDNPAPDDDPTPLPGEAEQGPRGRADEPAEATDQGSVTVDDDRPSRMVDRAVDELLAAASGRSVGSRVNLNLAATLMIGIAGGLALAVTVGAMLGRARGLVINIVVALFLSFGLEPAVNWLEDRGIRRGAGTGLVFLVGLVAAVGFIAAMLPLIIDQASNLIDNGQRLIDGLVTNASNLPGELGTQVESWLDGVREDLPSRVPAVAEAASRGVLGAGVSLLGSVFDLLTVGLITFYMTADAPRLRAVMASRLTPQGKREFLQVWDIAIEKTGGYVYSRVLTAVASSVFHTAVFLLIDLEYAYALGVWVGIISSLIPVVGTYLAGLLPVVVALAGSPSDVVWVVAAVVVYQALENYLVAPRITAHTLSLHPAVAFVSVLLGAVLLGAVGALLAIPATAIVAALFSARAEVHPHDDAAPDMPDGRHAVSLDVGSAPLDG